MKYNYLEAMKQDIREAIADDYFWNMDKYSSADEFVEAAEDYFWTDDCVTGNASGSYTFNRREAQEYVEDNLNLLREAVQEFCIDSETLVDRFMREDYEYFDITIRCYLLPQAIADIAEELEQRGAFDHSEEEQEAEAREA